jgi:hypothetical protein
MAMAVSLAEIERSAAMLSRFFIYHSPGARGRSDHGEERSAYLPFRRLDDSGDLVNLRFRLEISGVAACDDESKPAGDEHVIVQALSFALHGAG